MMTTPAIQKGIDCIGITVSFFCHDGEGNFLLARRGKNARDEQGKWDIGGGAVELGQTIDDCVASEISEEYCTQVISKEFLGYQDVFRTHEGQATHWVALYFKVLVDPSTVRNGEPHKLDEVKWFTRDTMPSDGELHSQGPYFFKTYEDKLFPPMTLKHTSR